MNGRHVFTLASLAAVGVLAFGYLSRARGPEKGGEEVAAVRAVIEAQQAAWNRGDVEGFMAGYAREDETTFVSGDTLTRGWQTALERYRRGTTPPPRWARSPSRNSNSGPSAPSTSWRPAAGS